MKTIFLKPFVLTAFIACWGSFLNAQYFDLTTGVGNIGDTDPAWNVQAVGSNSFTAATIVETHHGYAANSCGRWISHDIINDPGGQEHEYPASGPQGIYTYRYVFNLNSGNCFFEASLDLNFMAADNELQGIEINGNSISIPTGIDFNPGVSMSEDVTGAIVLGNNVVEVTVYNWGQYQALQLCGGITVSGTINNTTVVDLTSGANNAPLGSIDPIWTVTTTPSSSTPAAAYVADDVYDYQDPSNSYVTNACGQWISPEIYGGNVGGSAYQPKTQDPGLYTYTRSFTLDDCSITSATIDIPFLAADNEVTEIAVNGNAITIPNNTSHTAGQSVSPQNIASYLTSGTNTVTVTVNNWGLYDPIQNVYHPTYTALLICGDITIEQGCSGCSTVAPSNLTCSWVPDGDLYHLDWCGIQGSVGYDVEFVYNDPQCCQGGGELYAGVTTPSVSEVYFDSPEHCFSWRVRSTCSNGLKGPWSDYECSCGSLLIDYGKHGDPVEGQETVGSITVFPNPGTGMYEIEAPDAEHFEYQVTGLKGELIVPTTQVSGHSTSLDLSRIEAGIYLLQIQSGEQTRSIKLIKQ